MSVSLIARRWSTYSALRSCFKSQRFQCTSGLFTPVCCQEKTVYPRLETTRTFSSDSVFTNPYQIIHAAEQLYEGIHHYTHLPWWAVIVCSTVVFRSMFTLPLAIYQNKIIAKMELLLPTLKEYQEAVKHNIITKAKRAGMNVTQANKWMMKEAKKVASQLYGKEGCHPYKVAVLPWVQIPLWVCLSFALRDMSGFFPNLTPLNPEVTAAFAAEGALWFKDLTVPDPYYIFPVALAATSFMNIELHALKRQAPRRTQRILTNIFRILTIGMGVVATQMPAGMTLYWSVSSTYGLVQNVLFKYPKVRRKLSIPKTPSESKHPYRDLLDILKVKLHAFIELQRKHR